MQVANGQLTILNPHTPQPSVFWNGQAITGIASIQMINDHDTARVVLTVAENPILAEMKAAGIIIKREVIL